jgi:hypothetical protein
MAGFDEWYSVSRDREILSGDPREDARDAWDEATGQEREQCGQGVARIATERRRQVEIESWTIEHDDEHRNGEMALAAACYAHPSLSRQPIVALCWPWDMSWWKPSDRIHELEKAGALIAAEIERQIRLREVPDA